MTPQERTGTRDELVALLDETAYGAHMLTYDRHRDACIVAVDQLRAGASEVTAGHTIYRVSE